MEELDGKTYVTPTPAQEHRTELTNGLVHQRRVMREEIGQLEQAESRLKYLRQKVAAVEATLGQLGWVADDTPKPTSEDTPMLAARKLFEADNRAIERESLPPGSA